MKDFQHKRRWRRVLYSKSVLLVLLVLLIVAIQATWGVFEKQRQARETADLVERELSDLQNRNATLSHNIERLETDRGMEDVIRDSYQVGKDGERTIVVVDEKPLDRTQTIEPKGFWNKVVDWFR